LPSLLNEQDRGWNRDSRRSRSLIAEVDRRGTNVRWAWWEHWKGFGGLGEDLTPRITRWILVGLGGR